MKKTKSPEKKLPLVTTTIAPLSVRELVQVQGGWGTNTSWKPPCTTQGG